MIVWFDRQSREQSAARKRAGCAIAMWLGAVVPIVLVPVPSWAQRPPTQAAGAVAQQAQHAADWVAQRRSDAAAWVGQGASDAAETVSKQSADAAGAMAQQSADAAAETVPRMPAPLAPNPEFARFPRYGGMLGARRIVLRLGKKTDEPSGVHGEYQFADTGQVVLVAGDREGDVLEIEESTDGTSITGNWVGRFAADGSLAGERMNLDDSDPQPFDLRPLAGPSSTP
ncbi:MAG TPA: hypothetical protein VHC91_13555 [Trinickia sp.]|jgi:hypothetical protein|nr:hypothetical protein [Trinickia sp.]HVW51402.1 hypothetical protein [Trinickia sp.]